ncbi:MAG: hypothetical protein GY898_29580 [Proteobacteria bacterium]|nr:hypothetical protein [Pseudomonadota bacterium]
MDEIPTAEKKTGRELSASKRKAALDDVVALTRSCFTACPIDGPAPEGHYLAGATFGDVADHVVEGAGALVDRLDGTATELQVRRHVGAGIAEAANEALAGALAANARLESVADRADGLRRLLGFAVAANSHATTRAGKLAASLRVRFVRACFAQLHEPADRQWWAANGRRVDKLAGQVETKFIIDQLEALPRSIDDPIAAMLSAAKGNYTWSSADAKLDVRLAAAAEQAADVERAAVARARTSTGGSTLADLVGRLTG